MFTSNLLSAAFWDDPAIPRKSDDFFHRTFFFRSRTLNNPANYIDAYRNPVVLDQGLLNERLLRGPLHEIELDMIRDWELRENIWNEKRSGWYTREKEIWLATPWSQTYGRKQLLLFDKEYKKNLLRRDIFECGKLTQSLTGQVVWNKGRANYIASLQGARRWAWHAVGLLLSAAIPIRMAPVSRRKAGHKHHCQLFPSVEAAGRTSKYIPVHTKPTGDLETVAESVLFDPLYRDGVMIPPGSFDHLDYLDLVMKMVGYFAKSGAILQAPWLNEILRVEGVIRKYRVEQRGLPKHQRISTWAIWDFVLPEYNPNDLCRWDPAQNIWVKHQRVSQ
ncbi:hypothetical protein HD806DRAFT_488071 [Xylariaceae sp. AK1471]|nr:hypothetical protein HD806DRAFT_488071 [Xylariaceae sp. AK1471]